MMYPAPIVYDAERKMVACVLLQSLGGTPRLAMLINPKHWLVYPTDAMRTYMVKDKAMMDRIIEITTGVEPGEQHYVDNDVDEHELRKEELAKMSTKLLLDYLDKARKFGGWYSPGGSHSRWGYHLEDIKAELAKRPHVPDSPAKVASVRRREKQAANKAAREAARGV